MQQKSFKQKRLLLSAMLAGAIAAPAAAQTGVTVNGLADVFAGSLRYAGDAGRKTTVDSGGMTTSWIGLKGTEDLGGGLKAHFLLTSFIKMDDGTQGRFPNDTLFSRDANVGLSGSFGAVALGRGLAPHFLPTILFNPFGDSYKFSPLILHADVPVLNADFSTRWSNSLAADTGWSNSIRYTTPEINGLKANLHYQFGETAGRSGVNNYGINALYFRGPLALTAFYHNTDVANPLPAPTGSFGAPGGATHQEAWMLGASYELPVAKLFATYGRTSHNVDVNDKTASLGASVPYGQGKFLAAWAHTQRDTSGAEQKRNTASFGYDYNLSQRTDLYAIYMHDRITGLSSGNSVGLGLRHRF